jgi:predicted dehydrogenase
MSKVKWGVLSTAKIGTEQVIPAMQKGKYAEITAISSRSLDKAQAEAERLGIPKAYGSYDELLADPEIEAVYNPLPNHLHVSWSIEALDAGKHVLCEKPIAMSAAQAQQLVDATKRYPDLRVMEAFMYRFHPQWQKAKELVATGQIGQVRAIQTFFSYYNVDPNNIRNMADIGGGGLMDIGCYPISVSRFIFEAEPLKVVGTIERDPDFGIDRLTSAVMEFEQGTSTFICSTQLSPYQEVLIEGTEGWVKIEIPFNPPIDRPCRIWHKRDGPVREISLEIVSHYTIQGDLFSQAILQDSEVPTPIEDAVANMKVIDAIFQSADSGSWVRI